MKYPVHHLVDSIKAALPQVAVRVDEPAEPSGHWFVDVDLDGHKVVVEWRPDQGFGVSSSLLESGYGEGPEEAFANANDAAARVIDLLRTRGRTRPPRAVLLRELREMLKLTQEELAARLGIRQAAVSKMERRQDMALSTLRRLVEAMGGELEVVARFPEESVLISQFREEEEREGDPLLTARASCDHFLPFFHCTSGATGKTDWLSLPSSWQPVLSEHVSRVCDLARRDVQHRSSKLWQSSRSFDVRFVDDVVGDTSNLCRLTDWTVELNAKLMQALAERVQCDAINVGRLLVSHEIGHALLADTPSLPPCEQAELHADQFAGWVERQLGRGEASTGAALFYELGCRASGCTHPSPTARLDAFLKGFLEWKHDPLHRPCDRPERSANTSLDYVVFCAGALDQSRKFYEALGLSFTEERHGRGPQHYSAWLENCLLELYPQRQRTTTRLGLYAPSLQRIADQLVERDLRDTIRKITPNSLLLRDPDGNDIEIMERGAEVVAPLDGCPPDARVTPSCEGVNDSGHRPMVVKGGTPSGRQTHECSRASKERKSGIDGETAVAGLAAE